MKLTDIIHDYASLDPVRFHVPSHKGRGNANYINKAFDITELSFSDNLNAPSGVLADAEAQAAELFGALDTSFSTGGATAGVLAAVCASASGGKLLLPRNSHISCYYGALLADCDVVYAEVNDPIVGLTPNELLSAVNDNSGISACVLTVPTYFGCAGELETMLSILKAHGIISIVDAAHGAHFGFDAHYPQSAIKLHADIVIHSAHKSLNALGQCGLLHNVSGRISSSSLRFWLRAVSSTSPSYILICSIIDALEQLNNPTNALNRLRMCYNDTEAVLSSLGIPIVNSLYAKEYPSIGVDYMKLPLGIFSPDITAEKLNSRLETEYNIYSELVSGDILLLYAGLNSEPRDYERLCAALGEIAKDCRFTAPTAAQISSGYAKYCFSLPRELTMRRAVTAEGESCELSKAAGRIAAGFVSVYPPGTPCVTPGERLTKEVLDYLLSQEPTHLSGTENGCVRVVK